MIIKKEILRKLLMILFGINSFLHCSSIIIVLISDFLYIQNNFYYGVYIISFSLGLYYLMCIFFIRDEIFILEILIILTFSFLYSIFYIIPIGFITQSNKYSIISKLLVICFTFQIVNQITLIYFIFSHIAYFINMDDKIISDSNKIEIKNQEDNQDKIINQNNKDYQEYTDENDKRIENLD